MHVREIIARCNVHKIAKASERAGKGITVKGIYKWHSIGIPQKHWPVVMNLSGVSERQLYEANRRLEQERASVASKSCQRQKKGPNDKGLAA